MGSEAERSIVISALRAVLDPSVARKVPGQLDVFLELELSGTSVQTKVPHARRTLLVVQSVPLLSRSTRAAWPFADRTQQRLGASMGPH